MLVLSSAHKCFTIDGSVPYSMGELAHATSQPSCHREVQGMWSSAGLAKPALQHTEFQEEISHRVVQGGLKMALGSFGCSELGSTNFGRK